MKILLEHIAGGLTALLGLSVLIGRQAGSDALDRLQPEWPAMESPAALLFVLAGLGLVAAAGGRRRLAAALGGATILCALLLPGLIGGSAPTLALAFVLGGGALLALSGLPGTQPTAAHCFVGGLAGAGVALCGGLALLGHLVDLSPLLDRELLAALPVHAAAGLVALSGGLMIHAYRHVADEEGKVLRGVAAVVVAAQLALTLLLCGGLLRLDEQRQSERTAAEARSLGARFETVLHERAKAIDRMAERWEIGGGTPHLLWDLDATAYYNDMPGFQSLRWADSQGRVRWVIPEVAEITLAGLDLTRDPAQRQALAQANAAPLALYSGATPLADGRHGVMLVRALRVGKRDDGYLVAAFDVEAFFSRLVDGTAAQGYGLEVLRSGNTLYRRGATPETPTQIFSYWIDAAEDGWELRLWPIAGAMPSHTSLLPWLALVGGLALTAFTASLFLLWARGIRAALRLRLAATVFENSREAIAITDPEGCIVSVNRAFTKITGYTAQEAIGANPRILKSGRQDAAFYEDLWATIKEKGYWAGELWNKRKNGEIYPQAFSITAVVDAQGRPLHYIGMAYDITERRRREQALIAAKDDAEHANQAKSQFLSSMSHELRTPLNAVLGFSQLMQLDDGLTVEHKESLDQIVKAGTRLLDLVNELLGLARVEAGDVELTLAPVTFAELAGECLMTVAPLAREYGVRLDPTDLAPVAVLADRWQLKQVLLNLLSNAIKFNRKGGTVRVLASENGSGRVRITVSDSGRGIAPELLCRLFKPFERHDASAYDASDEGIGIGLAVSKRLVEAMGGSIGVDSEVGVGSTFHVILPLAGEAVQAEGIAYEI